QLHASLPADDDVPNFPSVSVGAVIELAVEDKPAANPGPREEAEYVLRPLRGAVFPFAVGSHTHVILDDDRPGPFGREKRCQVEVPPIQVRGVADDRRSRDDLAGHRERHPLHLRRIHTAGLQNLVHGIDNASEDCRPAFFVVGWLLGPGDDLKAVIQEPGEDFGPAQVNAEPVRSSHADSGEAGRVWIIIGMPVWMNRSLSGSRGWQSYRTVAITRA